MAVPGVHPVAVPVERQQRHGPRGIVPGGVAQATHGRDGRDALAQLAGQAAAEAAAVRVASAVDATHVEAPELGDLETGHKMILNGLKWT